jgi:hypothetical protein
MSANRLYHTVFERIRQLRPWERVTRLRNFAWVAVGIMLSRSVELHYIAENIPGQATNPSKTRRVRRFLDNSAVRVRDWYESVARNLLAQVVAHGLEVRLIADGTQVGSGHQLLMIALAYRRRALPLAWTWVKGSRGHSSAMVQLALLAYVRQLLPAGAPVVIVGDSEFGAVAVLQRLERWHWGYVMRQRGNIRVKLPHRHAWPRFADLAEKGAPAQWFPTAKLTREHGHAVHLLTWWKAGEQEPWLLATNLPSLRAARRAYKRRMWIEEMFGDFKGHGFDLACSRLRHFLRLSRLTLIVAFLYLWLVAFGSQVIKRGQRRVVDRADRKDLSVFRIGRDMLKRLLVNGEPLIMRLIPYFP